MSKSDLPLKIGMGYLIFTFALFLVGPMEWKLPHFLPVIGYISIIFLAIYVSFKIGSTSKIAPADLIKRDAIFLIGSLASIILLYPTSVLYTGRAPWQVFEALADQRDAYSMLREQLENTQGERGPIAFVRSVLGPFIFAVIPLGIIYWKNLSIQKRVLLGCTIISTMILSALRGTTRELADVVIVGGSAYIVSIYRNSDTQPKFSKNLPRFFIIGVLVIGVLAALTGRTEARLAGTGINTCIGGGYVCPAYDSGIYKELPAVAISVIATITGYFSQGYYGLALALDHDFIPSWGLGHSPAISSLYMSITGDTSYFRNTYIERLNQDAWSSDYQWSTVIPWFASDVSFWFVPFIMMAFGLLWSKSWNDAVYGKNDYAAVFFCLCMMFVFYFPANNQTMNTFENYITLLAWGITWAYTRRRALKI